MNIISNEKLIKRFGRIGTITMFAGLFIVVAGLFVSLNQNLAQRYFYLSFASLIIGFLVSQVGIYFTNRYGRKPRPDEILNIALKGLDNKYTLYHYMSPIPHLLVGPSGLWVILTRSQKGLVTYSKGRWRQQGGGFFSLYMRFMAQDGLGRPDLDFISENEKLTGFLKKNLDEGQMPPIHNVLVLTHPAASLNIPEGENPPAVTVMASKLKEVVRKTTKGKPAKADNITHVLDLLPEESIV
jgi:hypothetical protein